jgi:hypothetical protein
LDGAGGSAVGGGLARGGGFGAGGIMSLLWAHASMRSNEARMDALAGGKQHE